MVFNEHELTKGDHVSDSDENICVNLYTTLLTIFKIYIPCHLHYIAAIGNCVLMTNVQSCTAENSFDQQYVSYYILSNV